MTANVMLQLTGQMQGAIFGLVMGVIIGLLYGSMVKKGTTKKVFAGIRGFIDRFTYRRERIRVRVTPETFKEYIAKIGWSMWDNRGSDGFTIVNHKGRPTEMEYRPSDNSIIGGHGCLLFGKSQYGTNGNFRVCLDRMWMDYDEKIGAVGIYKYDSWRWWLKSRKATYFSFYNFDDNRKKKGKK